jgi:hypothetical protein
MKLPVVDESSITTQTGIKLAVEHVALPLSEDGTTVDRIFGSIDFFSHSENELRAMLPQLDWKKISSIELGKRIIISNLRFQI